MGIFQARQKCPHSIKTTIQKETQHATKVAHLFFGDVMVFMCFQPGIKYILNKGMGFQKARDFHGILALTLNAQSQGL